MLMARRTAPPRQVVRVATPRHRLGTVRRGSGRWRDRPVQQTDSC